MTDVTKQLLIDYADGRPLALMAADKRCHIETIRNRVRAALQEVDAIPDYRRKHELGHETVAAYWKIKFLQRAKVQHRKMLRGSARWSSVQSLRLRSAEAAV